MHRIPHNKGNQISSVVSKETRSICHCTRVGCSPAERKLIRTGRIGVTRVTVVVSNRKQWSFCIRRSFFFSLLPLRAKGSRIVERPWPGSSSIFQEDPSIRDARENNLESTLVAATPPQREASTHPNHPVDQRYLSARFSTFFLLPVAARSLYELSGPKLWPVQEPVNYQQHRRESAGALLSAAHASRILLPGVFARLPVTLSILISFVLFNLPMTVALSCTLRIKIFFLFLFFL